MLTLIACSVLAVALCSLAIASEDQPDRDYSRAVRLWSEEDTHVAGYMVGLCFVETMTFVQDEPTDGWA